MVKSVEEYVLINSKGSLKVKIINLGATIANIIYKDKNDQERDIVLGLDSINDYYHFNEPYFGSIIGRCANRIHKACFNLNGQTYTLEANKGHNSLHGGFSGFSRKTWNVINSTPTSIDLKLVSENGEGGYPACLTVSVNYSVTDNDELVIYYQAEILDANNDCLSTIVNLTNHSYFNLNGVLEHDTPNVLNHLIQINSKRFLQVNPEFIPTGQILCVQDYPALDFSQPREIGEKISQVGNVGYDHCYVLEEDESNYNIEGGELKEVVQVFSSLTGIRMKMFTTEPALQFYTGNYLHSELKNIRNKSNNPNHVYSKYSGFCLEAQRFPNSVNVDKWRRQCIIEPGKVYKQKTVYQFSVEK